MNIFETTWNIKKYVKCNDCNGHNLRRLRCTGEIASNQLRGYETQVRKATTCHGIGEMLLGLIIVNNFSDNVAVRRAATRKTVRDKTATSSECLLETWQTGIRIRAFWKQIESFEKIVTKHGDRGSTRFKSYAPSRVGVTKAVWANCLKRLYFTVE